MNNEYLLSLGFNKYEIYHPGYGVTYEYRKYFNHHFFGELVIICDKDLEEVKIKTVNNTDLNIKSILNNETLNILINFAKQRMIYG